MSKLSLFALLVGLSLTIGCEPPKKDTPAPVPAPGAEGDKTTEGATTEGDAAPADDKGAVEVEETEVDVVETPADDAAPAEDGK